MKVSWLSLCLPYLFYNNQLTRQIISQKFFVWRFFVLKTSWYFRKRGNSTIRQPVTKHKKANSKNINSSFPNDIIINPRYMELLQTIFFVSFRFFYFASVKTFPRMHWKRSFAFTYRCSKQPTVHGKSVPFWFTDKFWLVTVIIQF